MSLTIGFAFDRLTMFKLLVSPEGAPTPTGLFYLVPFLKWSNLDRQLNQGCRPEVSPSLTVFTQMEGRPGDASVIC
jgi:hypothetical protein